MKVGWTNLDYSKCYDFTAYGKGMFYYYSRAGAREWEGGFSSCVDLTNGFNEIQTGGACNPPLLLKQFKGECVSDDGKTIYLDPGR